MKTSLPIFFLGLFLFACTSKTKIELAPYEISDEIGNVGLKVDENGEIRIGGNFIATISEEGVLIDKDGKILSTCSDEGKLLDDKGQTLVIIDEEGKMHNGSNVFMYWSEEGKLFKDNFDTGLRINPVNPKVYQSASIVLYLYMNMSHKY
ncbi:hypothetical protein [Crocinitomix catalasitica]|uniref:hypothetical protein n=1 Tax=Crocinitomix catalasitica TaxID=184607 RepID=UPI000483FFA9|nr:hypothetical protein [Crocinitomix catalasitica]